MKPSLMHRLINDPEARETTDTEIRHERLMSLGR